MQEITIHSISNENIFDQLQWRMPNNFNKTAPILSVR